MVIADFLQADYGKFGSREVPDKARKPGFLLYFHYSPSYLTLPSRLSVNLGAD